MKRPVIWISAGLILGLALASWSWYYLALRPVQAGSTKTVSFEIPSGQGAPEIATRLKAAGLIRDRIAFQLYIDLHGLRADLQAGTYSLSAAKSSSQIADLLSQGKVARNLLVIPEGSNLVQIEKLAAARGIATADFKAALHDNYNDTYANQRPAGVDLEGYLFPDGYQINSSTTAHSLIQTMLTTFDQKITPDLASSLQAQGLSVNQGLTLASIVEREVANSADRPTVAQVFLSRIKAGQALQSDVTVQYAADQLGVPFNLNLDSPYNTYRSKGLPPGPICSPGLDALTAVAHPSTTDYLYFIAGKDGKTHFAHTLAEHQANIAKYLN